MSEFHEFLFKNEEEILELTESKSLKLAGVRASSLQLKQGLPIFFQQLLGILLLDRPDQIETAANRAEGAKGAMESDESAIAIARGKPEEAEVAKVAGLHGSEMLRLGYTLSHVVHAYGAMCQAITELAEKKRISIDSRSFHNLNECLDVAIAGAVTEYQKLRETQEKSREDQHLGFLTHELRNALMSATISLQLIERGTVGVNGSTGTILKKSLKRMGELIERSLTEIRLRVDPAVHIESERLLVIVDQILVTADVEAQAKGQKIELEIDPTLMIHADQQAFHSALSNLIQNAIKYTRVGGRIQVRGRSEPGEPETPDTLVVEVEDQCGGLPVEAEADLFKAFEQQNQDRSGLGLGLTIAKRAILLNHGKIEVRNLANRGCVFKITLPNRSETMQLGLRSAKIQSSALKIQSSSELHY